MSHSEHKALAFDAAVNDVLRRRRELDESMRYLTRCACEIEDCGGYAGKYFNLYLAIIGLDDVESALEDLEAKK